MKLDRAKGDWSSMRSWPTASGSWCGIAIGPESDDGIVLVDGVTLQAGRVLPLKANAYTITHPYGADELNAFSSLRVLDLMLFDDPAEMAIACARTNGRASVKSAAIGVAYTRVLVVPFSGRRAARISGKVVGAVDLGYQIVGRYFSPGEAIAREKTILTVGAVVGVRDFVEVVEAECFHELAIELMGSIAAVANAEGETFGELGL